MTDPGATLGDVIHQRTAAPTWAERRVARMLFAGDPMAGFDTVAELADATRRRIAALEHLREGYTWDEREVLRRPEDRTP